MPLDCTNFVETKPDVFSLDGLIAWLEMQPAAKPYVFMGNCNCMVAQYLKSHGIRFP